MKHRTQAFITLLTMLIAVNGCGVLGAGKTPLDDPQNNSTEPATNVTELTTEQQPTVAPTTAAETKAKTETNPTETIAMSVYDQIYTQLAAHETVIRFSKSLTQDTMSMTVNQVLADHPELFWVKQWVSTVTPSWSKLEFDTEESSEELAEMDKKLNEAVQEITDRVPDDADAFGKALFVHDYIVSHTDYNQDSERSADEYIGTTAYDCLIDRKAVCSGYSRAFQLVMQRLGFECGVCSGMSRGDSHAWNYIRIDDKYYWVDLTFDDPVSSSGEPDSDNLTHSYFMINDEMLLRTRTLDKDNAFVPVCDSMEQNYFVRRGSLLDAYTPEDVNAILAREPGDQRTEIMFRTSDCFQEAMTDLMDNEKIWDLPVFVEGGITNLHYQAEEDMYVLILSH